MGRYPRSLLEAFPEPPRAILLENAHEWDLQLMNILIAMGSCAEIYKTPCPHRIVFPEKPCPHC